MELNNVQERLINHLKKSNVKYEYKNNSYVIFLPSKLSIKISFDKEGNVEISNRILRFNFLTGLMEMTLANAVMYNTIGLYIIGFYYLLADLLIYKLPIGFVISMCAIIIINIIYYVIEFYYYKSKITSILGCI